MVLSRLTKITGPGVATDTNWVGNNADFTGITTTATSNTLTVAADVYLASSAQEGRNIVHNGTSFDPVASPCVSWNIVANGNGAYRFSGPAIPVSTDNPTIYVYRGFTYRFNNDTGSAHPFEIRQTSGGSVVTDGVSGNTEGVQFYTIPMSLAAGTTYVYQCTAHPAMVGNIVVV